MKILRKAIAPDGIEIQLEDWSEDFTHFSFGSLVAAYPKKYIRIRAEAEFDNHEKALLAFEKLIAGTAKVIDMDFTVMVSGGNRAPLKPLLEKCKNKYPA